jgi:oligopeptide/dipeptide ABC transporter ATP-binding protein
MAILLITHDLGVVAENADAVAVMYASRIIEYATVEQVFENPMHPYTEGLLKSVPRLGAESERLVSIPGTVPNPARFPAGCKFHPRCPRTRQAAMQAGGSAPVSLQYHGSSVSPAPPQSETVQIATTEETFSVLRLCAEHEPALKEVRPKHWASCHLVDNFPSAPITTPTLANKREVIPETVGAVVT